MALGFHLVRRVARLLSPNLIALALRLLILDPSYPPSFDAQVSSTCTAISASRPRPSSRAQTTPVSLASASTRRTRARPCRSSANPPPSLPHPHRTSLPSPDSVKAPILPWLRSIDGLNTHDASYNLSIAGGLTTALILPGCVLRRNASRAVCRLS